MSSKGTQPVASIERITPKLASEMLLTNRRNRRLRAHRVGQMAEAMRRGEWELNGESIKFDLRET